MQVVAAHRDLRQVQLCALAVDDHRNPCWGHKLQGGLLVVEGLAPVVDLDTFMCSQEGLLSVIVKTICQQPTEDREVPAHGQLEYSEQTCDDSVVSNLGVDGLRDQVLEVLQGHNMALEPSRITRQDSY